MIKLSKILSFNLYYGYFKNISQNSRFLGDYHGCIIGSGPSGLFLTQNLLKKSAQKGINLSVDIYDKLSTPYGLVRYGVAPDHQDVKSVEVTFEKILQDPKVSLLAGVEVGKSVKINEIKDAYDFVVLCYGQFSPKLLNIPGETYGNIFSGQSFVSWYNGHPSSLKMIKPNLQIKNAVVIGVGNVAIDVARLLLTDFNNPKNIFDIPEDVLICLKRKEIENVTIIGRGSVENVSFTIKEFRELTKKSKISIKINKDIFNGINIDDQPRNRQRLLNLIKNTSKISNEYDFSMNNLNCHMLFNTVPQHFMADINNQVIGVVVNNKNNNELQTINCGLVVSCIGYSGVSIDPSIVFDVHKGCILNHDGRVLSSVNGDVIPKMYCNGWLKTGPKGNIATTLIDSYKTCDIILQDIESNLLNSTTTRNDFQRLKGKHSILKILQERGIKPKSYDDWKIINHIEKQTGKVLKKVREKIVDESLIEEIIKK